MQQSVQTATPSRRLHATALTVAAAAVTIVLWASAFVVVRSAGHDFSPGALAFGRQLCGTIALTVVVLVRALFSRRAVRLPHGRRLAAVLLWGAAWFGAYTVALNSTERLMDAGTTALVVNVAPILVAVLAGILLREGFPRRLLVGIGVAFAGVALITTAGWSGHFDLRGLGLGLLAALIYAACATAQKPLLARVDAVTMTWLGCLAGTVACVPAAPDLARELTTADTASITGVVYLGVFPTAIAFLTWGYALSRMSAGRLAASTYLVPPIAVILAWAMLGELPAAVSAIGGAVCLAGVAIATLRKRG